MLINRDKELKELENILTSKNSSLINMYGRRRIGKTVILLELKKILEKRYKILYFVFYLGESSLQLQQLYKQCKLLFPEDNAIQTLDPSNWDAFFSFIFQLKDEFIILLDEFPFIVELESSIPSIIQKSWDTYQKSSNIKLLLCGSSVSLMRDIMNAKQPLYGRFTNVVKIEVMNFQEIRQFHKNIPVELQYYLYSIFGGIPYYHERILQKDSLEIILTLGLFAKTSFFMDEIILSLQALSVHHSSYFSILYAIASGSNKFSEIASRSKVSTKNLSYFINNLIEIGLVERVKGILVEKKSLTRYSIPDPFTRFWFGFIYSYQTELAVMAPETFVNSIVLPKLDKFLGKSFEDFSKEAIRELSLKRYFEEPIIKLESYNGQFFTGKSAINFEIDIVGSSIQKKVFIFAECKWWTKSITNRIINDFLQSVNYFNSLHPELRTSHKKIILLFFTRKEIDPDIVSQFPSIKFLCLQDIVKLLDNSKI